MTRWDLYASEPTTDTVAVELAGPPPPAEETFSKAAHWALAAGHATCEQAGALANVNA